MRCCGSQPVCRVAEPDSSSAPRKAWLTKGLSAPAQASQAAAETVPRLSMIRTVSLSPPSAMRPNLFYFQHAIDLDRDIARQRTDAHRGARVAPGLAENL